MPMVILVMDRTIVGFKNSSLLSAIYFSRPHQNPWISAQAQAHSPSSSSSSSSASSSSSSCPRCTYTQRFLDGLDLELPRLTVDSNKEHVMPKSPIFIHIIDESTYDIGHNSRRKKLQTAYKASDPPVQPSSPGKEDTLFIDAQEVETKPIYNMSSSYLSVSQSSRRVLGNATTLQMVTRPLQMKELKGTTGFYMAFVAFTLAIATMFKNVKLISTSNSPKAICMNCDGYGITKCELCKGRGGVIWEGKWTHIDPCPLCFGSCTCKCRSCGGIRVRKGRALILQQYSRSSMKTKRP